MAVDTRERAGPPHPGSPDIEVIDASENNLKNVTVSFRRHELTVITGVSGSGKSSLAFDTILMEARRRFFVTLSQYARQFLDRSSRPKVRQIKGLSPAVAMKQNETAPARSAKVGSVTDLFELFGVLFSRYGERLCPDHGVNLTHRTAKEIHASLLAAGEHAYAAVCAPIVKEKKGHYQKQLLSFAEKGFSHVLVDGELMPLAPLPQLDASRKHTIELVVDVIRMKTGGEKRFMRAVEGALAAGNGHGCVYSGDSLATLDFSAALHFGGDGSCPICSFSWPPLDTRWFSPNSLGSCPECRGYTYVTANPGEGEEGQEESSRETCGVCHGSGLNPRMSAIRYRGRHAPELYRTGIAGLQAQAREWLALAGLTAGESKTLEKIDSLLALFIDLSLHYLQLSRPIDQLSTGEWQKTRMLNVIGSHLRGMIYLFDEPSQGLSRQDLDQVIAVLKTIRARGGTVIAVDHDEALIRAADRILDFGPGGGEEGGYLVADFRPKDAAKFARQSATAAHLAKSLARQEVTSPIGIRRPDDGGQEAMQGSLTITGLRARNLKVAEATLPLGCLTVIRGPAGAGKTSLAVLGVAPALRRLLAGKERPGIQAADGPGGASKRAKPRKPAQDGLEGLSPAARSHVSRCTGTVNGVAVIDRSPIAKSSVSMPVTYLGVLTELRDLFGQLPEAQIAGYDARDFSLSTGSGRCPECGGRGYLTISMRYLEDARIVCPTCHGRRFTDEMTRFRYNDHSIDQILDLSIAQAAAVLANHRRIARRLQPAIDLGLGYLKLGQPSSSLSGGENQRLKFVPYFSKADCTGQVFILDEPTIGLHFTDTERLLKTLKSMIARGATVIAVENDGNFAAAADALIAMGPGAGPEGGRIVSSTCPYRNDEGRPAGKG